MAEEKADKGGKAPAGKAPGAKVSAAKASGNDGQQIDWATLGGLLLAAGGILGGFMLEHGNPADIAQYTAAVIVAGGTFGAILIATPVPVVLAAIRILPALFIQRATEPKKILEDVLAFAVRARKGGTISLEKDAEAVKDPFLKKALLMAIDGTDLKELRSAMEMEINEEEQRLNTIAKVYEGAGGYAPTIGIIGAVLGLIQVMKNLANIEEVGKGIAVAFVATIYGVGLANILLLPASSKIKARARRRAAEMVLMLEGICGIVEGLNPKMIERKLEVLTRDMNGKARSAPPKPVKKPPEAVAAPART